MERGMGRKKVARRLIQTDPDSLNLCFIVNLLCSDKSVALINYHHIALPFFFLITKILLTGLIKILSN
jgi:hypothetical protein